MGRQLARCRVRYSRRVIGRLWRPRLSLPLAAGLAWLCACSTVLGLREIDPASGSAIDAGADAEAGVGRTWMSGFLMRNVVDDTYRTQSVDDAMTWYKNIGTWRTGTSRNNCKIFNAIAYPDPGQAQTVLDYAFGTRNGSTWGLPARMTPSLVGLQALWSTPLTRGNDVGLKDTNAGNADASFKTWFNRLVQYGQGDAIVRLGWAMGGSGFAWSIAAPINLDATTGYASLTDAATAYKSAYRRVVDIARGVPGQKFRFEWNATYVDAEAGGVHVPASVVAAAYPGGPDGAGADYVDYVGLTLFDQSYAAGTPTIVQGTGSMAAASMVVTGWSTPSGRHFAATDRGRSIQVYTAGTSGGAPTSYPLFAKVDSVDLSASPPSATLNVPAARAVTGVMVNLFDAWPTAAFDDAVTGHRASLAAFAAFGREKHKPLAVSEWAPPLRMDGHGGNDDDAFVQLMYDFFADPANNVAYDVLAEGLDGSDVGPAAKSVVYPMTKQSTGSQNGPFHDGADAVPVAAAKYHELFGPL